MPSKQGLQRCVCSSNPCIVPVTPSPLLFFFFTSFIARALPGKSASLVSCFDAFYILGVPSRSCCMCIRRPRERTCTSAHKGKKLQVCARRTLRLDLASSGVGPLMLQDDLRDC